MSDFDKALAVPVVNTVTVGQAYQLLHDFLTDVQPFFPEQSIVVAGGCLRDMLLLNRVPSDIDLFVLAGADTDLTHDFRELEVSTLLKQANMVIEDGEFVSHGSASTDYTVCQTLLEGLYNHGGKTYAVDIIQRIHDYGTAQKLVEDFDYTYNASYTYIDNRTGELHVKLCVPKKPTEQNQLMITPERVGKAVCMAHNLKRLWNEDV